ncbi:MAG: XRE family transcriptional regulator [Betaproteobacteria bacterium]|nr:XRE family transcriptional regulator [Betaproteobacteria bacterium]
MAPNVLAAPSQRLRSALLPSGWTQAEAARRCGVSQPRVNDLLRGRISRFSLDALVNIAAALGRRVHVELEPLPL